MKHLLKLLDLTTEEIIDILNLADQLKYEQKHGISHKPLAGKTLGMIFQKSSTRTRVSFETGIYQLGAKKGRRKEHWLLNTKLPLKLSCQRSRFSYGKSITEVWIIGKVCVVS